MKRIAFLLACLMVCVSLCSCAIEPIADASPYAEGSSSPAQPDEPDEPDEPDKPEQSTVSPDGEYVLYDTDDLAITVTSIKEGDDEGEWTITVQHDNKSDKALDFNCDYIVVNGWQPSDLWYTRVEPGESATETMELSQFNMGDQGLPSVDKVTFCFEVMDSDDWYADPILSDSFTIYPTGLTDDQIVIPERQKRKEEYVIADTNEVEFVILNIDEDAYIGTEIFCYMENKTDKALDFAWEKTTVNNWAIDPYFYTTTAPHSRSYIHIYLDQASLDLCGIEQIDELSFDLQVFPTYDFDGEYCINENYCLLPTGMSSDDIPDPERTPVAGEQVILDNEDLTIIIDPLARDDDSVYMNMYVHNRTGFDISVSLDNFTVNGSGEVVNFVYEHVPAVSHLYFPIDFMEYYLNGVSLDDVKSIQCDIEVVDLELFEIIFSEQFSSSF